jgi:hypothetical protein
VLEYALEFARVAHCLMCYPNRPHIQPFTIQLHSIILESYPLFMPCESIKRA